MHATSILKRHQRCAFLSFHSVLGPPQDAKKSLEDLQESMQQAIAKRQEHRKQELEVAASAKAEENELLKISDAERLKDASSKSVSTRNTFYMKSALSHSIWSTSCGGRVAGTWGGAVCMRGDLVLVSGSDDRIKVFDLETVMFQMAKECYLEGHTK